MSQWMEVQYNMRDGDKLTQIRRCLQFLKSEAKVIHQLVEQSWPMGLSRRTEDRWSEIALLKSPFLPSFRNLLLMSFTELLRVKARPECPEGGTLTECDGILQVWYGMVPSFK